MSELILRRRPPIEVVIPAAGGCEVNDCDRPDTHVVYWIDSGWTRVENALICSRDAFLFKGIPGCQVFPQSYCPTPEWVLDRVNREILSRRSPVQQYYYDGGTGSNTGTQIHFNMYWGGQQ